jgi:hypothetical protein
MYVAQNGSEKGPKSTDDIESMLGAFEIEAFDPVVFSLLLIMHMLPMVCTCDTMLCP